MEDCLKISSFPEKDYISKVSDKAFRVRLYGEQSYTDRIAVVTHWLHNRKYATESSASEAVEIIKDYLSNELEGLNNETLTSMACEPLQYSLFSDYFDIPFPSDPSPKITFIDLFAGMGGFRLAMQAQGGKCVFSSEWNTFAQKTYIANFGDMPFGDITRETTKSYIPEQFDVLCAGFPCQPFSIAGVSKIYYGVGSRNEYRLTRFGRGFPFLTDEYTGALFILIQTDEDAYSAFVLNHDEDIDAFLENHNLSASNLNRIFTGRRDLKKVLYEYIVNPDYFPTTSRMGRITWDIHRQISSGSNPDKKIIDLISIEYELFESLPINSGKCRMRRSDLLSPQAI